MLPQITSFIMYNIILFYIIDKSGEGSSLSSKHSSSGASNRFNEANDSHTNSLSNKGLIIMSETYELQVDTNDVSKPMNKNQDTDKVSIDQDRKDIFSSNNMNEQRGNVIPTTVTSPSKG